MKFWLRLIGIALFVYIIYTIDTSVLVDTFTRLSWQSFVIVLLLFIPQIWTKAYRWHLILKKLGMKFSVWDCFVTYAVGLFVGTVTFGKLGEFIRMFYLKEKGYDYGKSFFSVIADRIVDVIILFALGIAAFGIYGGWSIGLTAVIVAGICFVLLLVFWGKLAAFAGRMSKRLGEVLKNAGSYFGRLNDWKTILPVVLLSIATWMIYFLQVYVFASSAGLEISYFYLSLVLGASAIVTMIPISISGIGTRDAVLIYFFALIGLASEQAVTVSLIVLTVYLLAAAIGFVAWLSRPVDMKKLRKHHG